MRHGGRPATTRQGQTLVFTDVIGSTEILDAVGDVAYTRRRKAHSQYLRAVVAAHGGQVVDEAGDGIFAAFPSASEALRAAARIASTSAAQAEGLPLRIGVHSGEVEVGSGTVTGVAVHVAARVMALGQEGQVMVSRVCADQVRGGGFRFEDAGEHVLKGLDGHWQVLTLDLTSALPPEEPAPALRAPAGRRRVGAAALALVLAASAGFAVVRGGPDDAPRPTAAAPTVAPPQGDAAAAVWGAVRPLALARQQTGAAAVPGAIIIAGGLVEDGATATVERYDPAIDAWQPAPDLPLALHHAAVTAYQDRAVVIGGWSPMGTSRLTRSISDRVLVLDGDGWTDLPPLLQPRAAAAAAVVGDRLYVTGGQGADGELVDTTEVFDGTAWKAVAPLPTPRDHLALAADGRYLYAVGGRRLTTADNLDTLERYDPEQDAWTSLPPMPTARGGVAAGVVDGRLVVTGGEAPTGPLRTAESYDLTAGTWSRLRDLPEPVHGEAAAVLAGSLYLAGGAASSGHSTSTSSVSVLELPLA